MRLGVPNKSTTRGMGAAFALEAALLEDKPLRVTALRAEVVFALGAVGDKALQGPAHAVFPGVDVVPVKVEVVDQVDHIDQWHAVAKDAGDQLGIVPVLLVKRPGEPLDVDVVALAVDKPEVVAAPVLPVPVFDDPAVFHVGGQREGILGLTSEDLVGFAV